MLRQQLTHQRLKKLRSHPTNIQKALPRERFLLVVKEISYWCVIQWGGSNKLCREGHSFQTNYKYKEDYKMKMNKIYALALVATMGMISFAPAANAETKIVVASFYGEKNSDGTYDFHGNDMANGIPFNMYDPVNAAHKELSMCTQVKLKYPKNGRKLTVVITDRGPFIKGRDYDLSRAAADHLGFVKAGKASLEVLEIIPPLTEKYIYDDGCEHYLQRG